MPESPQGHEQDQDKINCNDVEYVDAMATHPSLVCVAAGIMVVNLYIGDYKPYQAIKEKIIKAYTERDTTESENTAQEVMWSLANFYHAADQVTYDLKRAESVYRPGDILALSEDEYIVALQVVPDMFVARTGVDLQTSTFNIVDSQQTPRDLMEQFIGAYRAFDPFLWREMAKGVNGVTKLLEDFDETKVAMWNRDGIKLLNAGVLLASHGFNNGGWSKNRESYFKGLVTRNLVDANGNINLRNVRRRASTPEEIQLALNGIKLLYPGTKEVPNTLREEAQKKLQPYVPALKQPARSNVAIESKIEESIRTIMRIKLGDAAPKKGLIENEQLPVDLPESIKDFLRSLDKQ